MSMEYVIVLKDRLSTNIGPLPTVWAFSVKHEENNHDARKKEKQNSNKNDLVKRKKQFQQNKIVKRGKKKKREKIL